MVKFKKPTKIILVFTILVISFIGGFVIDAKGAVPKNIDNRIYSKTICLMAYYERSENNNSKVSQERLNDLTKYISEIQKSRKLTKEENEVLNTVLETSGGIIEYKETNKQEMLDMYTLNKNKMKKLLNLPNSKNFNELIE